MEQLHTKSVSGFGGGWNEVEIEAHQWVSWAGNDGKDVLVEGGVGEWRRLLWRWVIVKRWVMFVRMMATVVLVVVVGGDDVIGVYVVVVVFMLVFMLVISVFDEGNENGGGCGEDDDGGVRGGAWHEVRRTQLVHLPHSQPLRALRESCSWRSQCLDCC